VHLVPIQGSFSIYGSVLSNPWSLYPAFAPRNQGLEITSIKEKLGSSGYELDADVRQTLESLVSQIKNRKHALIGIVGCDQNGLKGIKNVMDTTKHIFEDDCSSDLFKISGFYPVEDASGPFLHFPPIWQECMEDVNQNVQVMCVVGAKNVGKSTFARYSLNSLLSSHENVAFLECDPGQSEFTPPGTVSLNIVSKPCIGIQILVNDRSTIYSLTDASKSLFYWF
jgi:polynucleotide 5'-hydroxyl-kinase GRC3/NOL9